MDHAKRLGVAAALAALVAWSSWNRWLYLSSTPFPVGVDGYFYAVQLRSILEHGHLQYAASPLAFWLMAPFAWATDPIVGAKLGAAILGALIAVPAYFVGKRLGGSWAAGLLAAAIATPSAGSFYLSLEFVKNGVGLTVAVTYLWLLLRALEAPRPGRLAAAAALLLATFLTHKMAAGFALLVTVPAAAAEGRLRQTALIAAGVLGLFVIASLAVPSLGGRELALLGEMFTPRAEWEAPALRTRQALWMGHEPLLAGAVGLALVIVVVLRLLAPSVWHEHPVRRSALGCTLALAVLAIVIALPWIDVRDPQGLGFRLRVAAFVPFALCAAALLGHLAALAPARIATPVMLAVALIWAIAQPRTRAEGAVPTHPALASATAALAGHIPDDAVIVCPERHIVFMAAWYTRADVRLRPEGAPAERIWRLLPLAFIGNGSPLDDALLRARAVPGLVAPRGFHPRHPNGLVLLPEATWEWVLTQLPPDRAARLRRWRTI